jgi:hypothetical protein
MNKNVKPVAEQAAGEDARFDVKLNKRFSHEGFDYLPGHQHEVNKALYDLMASAGVIESGKQLP